VHPRCAVGAAAGSIEINISENSVSSSVLPILGDHVSAAPGSRYVGREKVPVITLDSLQSTMSLRDAFLKIDTQGFEAEVLKGARQILPTLVGLQIECSVAPLYLGQADFLELLATVRDAGFQVWSLDPGFRDRASGRLLQFDAVFFRAG